MDKVQEYVDKGDIKEGRTNCGGVEILPCQSCLIALP
jgi:hypothetical protein